MRGRLVEWVEKVSFDHLNKLFVIYAVKMNHQTLLMNQNLLAVVQEPQPYVLLVIPRLFPKVLVLEEHHMLKNISFYEVACEADAKAC